MSEASGATVFRNVRVFDGLHATLAGPSDVVVRGNIIESVRPCAEPARDDANIRIIDGAGRVLTPGLIDAHWHATFAAISTATAITADPGYVHLVAGAEAERTLLRGFTTVRDAGGPTFALKRAIDEGVIVGPRIYPSGAFISQTAGHGDFRSRHEVPRHPCRHLSHLEIAGAVAIADGVDEVLRAVREQLMSRPSRRPRGMWR